MVNHWNNNIYLVGGLEHEFYDFLQKMGFMFCQLTFMFFRGVEATNQIYNQTLEHILHIHVPSYTYIHTYTPSQTQTYTRNYTYTVIYMYIYIYVNVYIVDVYSLGSGSQTEPSRRFLAELRQAAPKGATGAAPGTLREWRELFTQMRCGLVVV